MFAASLDAAPIRATSILNGAFTDMLTGQAPLIVFKHARVLFWSSADQALDFTTKDDAAFVTAHVALDADAPRVVDVADDRMTTRNIAGIMTTLTGQPHKLQSAGTTGTLLAMSKVGRRVGKDSDETFPAWQGMQYFVSMFSGEGQLRHVGNERFAGREWGTVRDVLAAHLGGAGAAAVVPGIGGVTAGR